MLLLQAGSLIACVCQLFNIPRGPPSRSRMEITTSPKSPFHSSPELHTNHTLTWRRTPSHRATGQDSIGRTKRTTKPLYAFPSTSPRDTAPTSRLGGPLGRTPDGVLRWNWQICTLASASHHASPGSPTVSLHVKQDFARTACLVVWEIRP
ncbi:uncharacterized protein BDZ83DRAFT_237562 [Colletotrichum acutatum]|uniref:Secreted protein n=1 Tax=Glomerella acutata TaxID=27357 RepID=A0AAD8UM42_GLOAC|nr:uncharacterized protein BDZ83DRAFT_237562 [Colletotrichum acutatum]KAK1726827.1 hypothetical protein BDZ83DRAFT_237562 [Colletotrichum acutatum]